MPVLIKFKYSKIEIDHSLRGRQGRRHCATSTYRCDQTLQYLFIELRIPLNKWMGSDSMATLLKSRGCYSSVRRLYI